MALLVTGQTAVVLSGSGDFLSKVSGILCLQMFAAASRAGTGVSHRFGCALMLGWSRLRLIAEGQSLTNLLAASICCT